MLNATRSREYGDRRTRGTRRKRDSTAPRGDRWRTTEGAHEQAAVRCPTAGAPTPPRSEIAESTSAPSCTAERHGLAERDLAPRTLPAKPILARARGPTRPSRKHRRVDAATGSDRNPLALRPLSTALASGSAVIGVLPPRIEPKPKPISWITRSRRCVYTSSPRVEAVGQIVAVAEVVGHHVRSASSLSKPPRRWRSADLEPIDEGRIRRGRHCGRLLRREVRDLGTGRVGLPADVVLDPGRGPRGGSVRETSRRRTSARTWPFAPDRLADFARHRTVSHLGVGRVRSPPRARSDHRPGSSSARRARPWNVGGRVRVARTPARNDQEQRDSGHRGLTSRS